MKPGAPGAGILRLHSFGMPVAHGIGFASLLVLLIDGSVPLVVFPQRMFVGVNSFELMAIPFFMLAGEFMNSGGINQTPRELLRHIGGPYPRWASHMSSWLRR